MKVIIDDKIPYIHGALEPYADVIYTPGHEITRNMVKDADALITRTRTLCDEELLAGSSVKLIATATIGHDHIDAVYCDKAGIAWTNAPGCNAKSVEQYIASALFTWSLEHREKLHSKTIGIVGVGNVGSKVARLGEILGMRVLLNDPPRARMEGPEQFVPLETITREADIVSFHVPLHMLGEDATFHMSDGGFFGKLKNKPLVINSCRGEVFHTPSVKTALKSGQITDYIVDCWENEPHIDLDLMGMAYLATPHIAGYSRDGKANGTMMSVQAVSRFFGLGIDHWKPEQMEPPSQPDIFLDGSRRDEESIMAEAVLNTYDIEADAENLRANPERFEKLRGDYPVRREFPAYRISTKQVSDSVLAKLQALGFSIE